MKVRRNRKELHEHYRTADEQGSLPIFSANSVAIPPLYSVKIIQAKNIFWSLFKIKQRLRVNK